MHEGEFTTAGSYSYSGSTCAGLSAHYIRELFIFRTEGSTCTKGSAHFSRELFLFSREHMYRREHSLQQEAIHIQEGAVTTKGSYSYSVASTCAGGSAC